MDLIEIITYSTAAVYFYITYRITTAFWCGCIAYKKGYKLLIPCLHGLFGGFIGVIYWHYKKYTNRVLVLQERNNKKILLQAWYHKETATIVHELEKFIGNAREEIINKKRQKRNFKQK